MKPKIVSVLGARPQFVKAAVLSRIIRLHNQIQEVIVHTGQHYDTQMSAVFFEEMQIPKPDYFLDINGLSHGAMTGQMLEKIEEVLLKEKPQAVVVYGDTNSTLAGALAASKLGIPLAHVEAGLRSFNMNMPEEINRILTDRISDLLLCPTDKALKNLKMEGFDHFTTRVIKTGDIMKNAVRFYSEYAEQNAKVYQELKLPENQFVLVTIHRQENTDNPEKLKAIFSALDSIQDKMPVILPLHPRTKKALANYSINTNVRLIEPVGYFDMLMLLKNCKMVITDSGGLQKEAFFNSKPVIVTRDETEWVELVEHGFAKIVGSDKTKILHAFDHYLSNKLDFDQDLYGHEVGQKIHDEILKLLT